jgi:hypothetical protein
LFHRPVHAHIARGLAVALVLNCTVLAACAAEISGDETEYDVSEEALQFAQVGTLVSMEAEDFTSSAAGIGAAAGSRWTRTTGITGYSSSAALATTPNAGVNVGDSTQGPRLNYSMTMSQTGTYYVWLRMRGTSTSDESVHVGINGAAISYGGLGVGSVSSSWRWESSIGTRRLSFNVAAPGVVTLNVWMREDGVALDKLLVTRDSAYVPSGTGPVQTATTSTAGTGGTGGTGGTTTAGTGGTAGTTAAGTGGTSSVTPPPVTGTCTRARRLWFDDFESGTYARWTSGSYVSAQNGGGCYSSGISTERARTGTRSQRSSIACTQTNNHRIYGGMQFSGDTPLTRFTNTGTGIDAPNGIVVTYWSWLDSPAFGSGRWMSMVTANNSCDWSDRVVTVGLEDSSNRLTPAHITNTGGTLTYASTRAALPMRQWVRTTVYLNYHTGVMHLWQNGVKQLQATFRRNTRQICHFHWGLYASGANSSITLFEDDFSLWKLDQPVTDFAAEPWLGQTQSVCP